MMFQRFTHAKLTLKSQLSVVSDFKRVLTPEQEKIFREHCLGHWLDLKTIDNDPGYVHHLLQLRCNRPILEHPRQEPDELWFQITPEHYIRFGRREFCLVTGLRFGPNVDIAHHIISDVLKTTPAFKERVFPKLDKLKVKNTPIEIYNVDIVRNVSGMGSNQPSSSSCFQPQFQQLDTNEYYHNPLFQQPFQQFPFPYQPQYQFHYHAPPQNTTNHTYPTQHTQDTSFKVVEETQDDSKYHEDLHCDHTNSK